MLPVLSSQILLDRVDKKPEKFSVEKYIKFVQKELKVILH